MPSDDHDGSSKVITLDGTHGLSFGNGIRADEARLLAEAQASEILASGQAFAKLIAPYERPLEKLIRDLLRGAVDDTSDIKQDTIERAWRRLRRPPTLVLERDKPYWAFLQRIARNRVAEYWSTYLRRVEYVGKVAYISSLDESRTEAIGGHARISPRLPSVDDEPGDMALEVTLRELIPVSIQEALQHDSAHTWSLPECRDSFDEIDMHRYDRGGRTPLIRALRLLDDKQRGAFILAHHCKLKQREIALLLGLPPGTVAWRMHEATHRVTAVLASIWWEEDGYSPPQIAKKLNVPLEQVEQYVDEGYVLRRNGSDFDV